MTSLSAPIPPTPDPAPVMRVTWRHCFYCAVGLVWWVLLAHFLLWPPAIGWWAVLLAWVPGMVVIDVAVSHRWLDTEPVEATPTHMPCCGCGAFMPRHLLRADDGLCCPACATKPISTEVA